MQPSSADSSVSPPARRGDVSGNGIRALDVLSIVDRPWRLALFISFACTLISLCQAAQYYYFSDTDDGHFSWTRALSLGFALWYAWGLLGMLAFCLSRRFPLGEHHWPTRLGLHMAFCFAFAAAKILIDYPIIRYLYTPRPNVLTFAVFLRMAFGSTFLRFCLYYWAIIGAWHALDYYGKYRRMKDFLASLEAS